MVKYQSEPLQFGPDLPKLGKQHHVQHAPQIGNARRSASAALEADDPFDRRHMIEAPAAEVILEIHQLFGELIELPKTGGIAIHRLPCGSDAVIGGMGYRDIAFDDITVDAEAATVQNLDREIVDAGGP